MNSSPIHSAECRIAETGKLSQNCERCKILRARKKNAARRMKHAIYTDLGLVRVRGNLGGVYYE